MVNVGYSTVLGLAQEEKDMTLEEAVNFIDETVQESVATHKIADVESWFILIFWCRL